MDFSIKTSAADAVRTECAIVPVLAGRKLTAGGQALDAALGGALSGALARGDLPAKAGSTLLVYGEPRRVERVLLVALGDDAAVSEKSFAEAAKAGLRGAGALSVAQAASLLHEAEVADRGLGWRLRVQVAAGREAAYRFDRMKSKKDATPVRPGKVLFVVDRGHAASSQRAVDRAVALANGMDLARDLGNLPGNVCTPAYLAERATQLSAEFPELVVKVLERKDCEELGMGSFLSVTRGSEEPPRFIVLEYLHAQRKQARPCVLVGKGITFDTGGVSLKPGPDMDQMKFDMCGAAAVLGTLRAVAEMKAQVNVVGLIPACENMPSGRATKPGDIVTSMSGQTIEILNTDAEGRLILADALTYAERYDPEAVVDVATLTGAMVIALGHVASGLFSNNETLARALVTAGDDAFDRAWQLPLWEDYQEGLQSNFADFANIGGRAGGSITAACFLSRFTKKYDWAHLDIAGTAWKDGKEKGATGRPVPLLTTWLLAHENPVA